MRKRTWKSVTLKKRTSVNDCKKHKYIPSRANINKRVVSLDSECKKALFKGQRGACRYDTDKLN